MFKAILALYRSLNVYVQAAVWMMMLLFGFALFVFLTVITDGFFLYAFAVGVALGLLYVSILGFVDGDDYF